MSAIAGIIHFDSAPVAAGHIERMTAAMAARGPDGSSHWIRGSVALGHCMLRATPESLEETQPLVSDDGNVVLVMDGRVDNWLELRKELLARGLMLRSCADAELVLQAYLAFGDAFLARVEGDFALAIWDGNRQTAVLARDRTGMRPLYCWRAGQTLVFASAEAAILLLPQVPNEPNKAVLAQYLASQWFTADETLWKGLRRIRPAEQLLATHAGWQHSLYWQPDVDMRIRYSRLEDYRDHYRELLTDIVRRLSRSQYTLAIEVSGGLDSSALYCMAQHLLQQQQLPAPGVDGYTLAFHDDTEANEVEYSRDVGRFWGRQIQEVLPAYRPLSWYGQQAATSRVLPGYPNAIILADLVAQARNQGSRVLLNGDGGDEWLGGSRAGYADLLAAAEWQQLWRCLQRDGQQAGWPQALRWLAVEGLLPQLPFRVRTHLRHLITPRRKWGVDREGWLSPELHQLLEERRPPLPARPQTTGRPGQRSQLNLMHGLEFQLARELWESLYAEAGLELRKPYWHPRMVQFAFATPEHVRLQGGVNRALHRQAMAGLMPDSVLNRHDKADFMGCFHHHLPAMQQLLTADIPARHPDWINRQQTEKLYRMSASAQHMGWPEWMLWILFGCDAIFSHKSQAVDHINQERRQ